MCFCVIGSYEFTISEDLGIGKPGGRVKANDRDIGENAKSTYSIIAGDEKDVFEIVTDSQTQEGILTLKKVRRISFLFQTEGIFKCQLFLMTEVQSKMHSEKCIFRH